MQSLGQEDPLEKKMATHASILAWRMLWTEETGRLQPIGSKESDLTERLTFSLSVTKGHIQWKRCREEGDLVCEQRRWLFY